MRLHEDLVLLPAPALLPDVRVELVVPTLSALLARSARNTSPYGPPVLKPELVNKLADKSYAKRWSSRRERGIQPQIKRAEKAVSVFLFAANNSEKTHGSKGHLLARLLAVVSQK